ncbi:MAG: hypothetical protein QOH61_2224 [Chloroflexota bacterium]|jgi:hypothetical protein|nr:hypothetical protein [Chloroflexota bacterium]
MKTSARLTGSQRDRAFARLRSITVGTAVASTAAAGAFGFLAVQTNPGTQAANDSGVTTAAAAAAPTTSPTGADTTTSGTTGSTLAAPTAAPTSTPATTTTRRHATSGGS